MNWFLTSQLFQKKQQLPCLEFDQGEKHHLSGVWEGLDVTEFMFVLKSAVGLFETDHSLQHKELKFQDALDDA